MLHHTENVEKELDMGNFCKTHHVRSMSVRRRLASAPPNPLYDYKDVRGSIGGTLNTDRRTAERANA